MDEIEVDESTTKAAPDPSLVVCPSGLTVRVTKVKVRQFKLFGNRKALESGEVFEEILSACAKEVVDPGPAYKAAWNPGTVFDWKKALQGDRFAVLLGIRSFAHGDDFDFDVTCQHCSKEIPWTLKLADLKRVPYPEKSIEVFTSRGVYSLKVSGRLVSYKLMTGAEEDRIRQHLQRLENTDKRTRSHPFDPIIDGALARIHAVEGLKREEWRDWYEDLDADEMQKIAQHLEATAGGVETSLHIHHDVLKCGGTSHIELPFVSKDFWIKRGTGLGSGVED